MGIKSIVLNVYVELDDETFYIKILLENNISDEKREILWKHGR